MNATFGCALVGIVKSMDRTTRAWWIVVVIMAAACVALLAHATILGALLLVIALPALVVADVLWFRRNRR
ncbi:MAG: hypothetical protein ACRDLT_15400 [Solirubrobacteraceae bacterium]